MDITKLENELLQLTINQLPALYQVAVSRVCTRFKDFALKTTTVLDVKKIPRGHRLEVVKKMPKLVSIVGLQFAGGLEVSFLESVPEINLNIVQVRSGSDAEHLSKVYLESAKMNDANYTGSRLRSPFRYEWYKELTSKYPDLDIKCYLNTDPNEEYHGDKKCHLAVTRLKIRSLKSSRITNLLKRTINVTHLDISFQPDYKEFTLFPFLDTIARLPLEGLRINVEEFKIPQQFGQDGNLVMPLERNKKYTLTGRDYSSLQNVLSVQSLRNVYLDLDCVLDVQNLYNSFIHSSNNNYNKFHATNFILSFRNQCGNIRHHRGYYHQINIDSLPDFDIVEFLTKFKTSPARIFIIRCSSDKKWNEIKTKCEQFTKSRQDYSFTLGRSTDSLRWVEAVEYNLWKVEWHRDKLQTFWSNTN